MVHDTMLHLRRAPPSRDAINRKSSIFHHPPVAPEELDVPAIGARLDVPRRVLWIVLAIITGVTRRVKALQAHDANDHIVTTSFGGSVGWTGFSGGSGAWLYRKPITINSSSALTDYQVDVTFAEVDTAGLIGAGKMQSDYDDTRFTTSDGSTEIDYWIDTDKFVVEVPGIASGSTNIYIYQI